MCSVINWGKIFFLHLGEYEESNSVDHRKHKVILKTWFRILKDFAMEYMGSVECL